MKETFLPILKQQKETFENAIKSQRGVPPELQHLIEPVTYDLPDHTVTVSQISNIDSIHASTTIDLDKTLPSTCVEEMQLKETKEEVDKLRQQIKDLKGKRLKTLKKSKVQIEAKNMQRKKDKQKAWKLRRLFQKGVEHTKKSHKKKKR
ncbi:uncharacterized protein TNCT_344711 [Trichonephila clavata]|uniref:Uncharacterized protein n=1 Tax=Trichonephila clavata TaxID=2740835 RepID=A0A8X6H2M0_TRICU|nr:uncharacterized protein TNCT_344711 [Trichonephila clavata]